MVDATWYVLLTYPETRAFHSVYRGLEAATQAARSLAKREGVQVNVHPLADAVHSTYPQEDTKWKTQNIP